MLSACRIAVWRTSPATASRPTRSGCFWCSWPRTCSAGQGGAAPVPSSYWPDPSGCATSCSTWPAGWCTLAEGASCVLIAIGSGPRIWSWPSVKCGPYPCTPDPASVQAARPHPPARASPAPPVPGHPPNFTGLPRDLRRSFSHRHHVPYAPNPPVQGSTQPLTEQLRLLAGPPRAQ
jgi:hypothetical protein